MEPIEEYQELVERNAKDISILWKLLQTFFYLCGAVSGYVCSIASFIFWYYFFTLNIHTAPHCYSIPKEEMLDGQCVLWIYPSAIYKPAAEDLEISSNDTIDFEEASDTSLKGDWRDDIVLHSMNNFHCDFHYITSLCSCVFGTAWFTLFTMCGRGGYGNRIYIAPWRIVVPALAFNFVFMVVVVMATRDVEYGFRIFSSRLRNFANGSECDVLQDYFEPNNASKRDVCQFYKILAISSWIMAASWVAGFVILVLRLVNVTDFRLLKVTIYNAPPRVVTNVASRESKGRLRKSSVDTIEKKKKFGILLPREKSGKDN